MKIVWLLIAYKITGLSSGIAVNSMDTTQTAPIVAGQPVYKMITLGAYPTEKACADDFLKAVNLRVSKWECVPHVIETAAE